jgi:hypothetical protein
MYRRVPEWACRKFPDHGKDVVCESCQKNFRAQGSKTQYSDLPPRAKFGRGWFSVGATHWFEATDATVFPARDGHRVLAQAFCGGVCEVTIAYAPQAEMECARCVRALKKAGALRDG